MQQVRLSSEMVEHQSESKLFFFSLEKISTFDIIILTLAQTKTIKQMMSTPL
jgi:hypothetical protein